MKRYAHPYFNYSIIYNNPDMEKICLLIGRKAMTSLDCVLKSRDIATKGPSSQSYGFSRSPVWMWELSTKEIDAFELWCWRRLLRLPWAARRSNLSILKISPGCSLEGLMLKLQYFGHLMWRTDSLEKILMLRKIEGRRKGDDRGWDGCIASLTRHEFEQAPGIGDGQGSLDCCSPWGCKESDTTEWLNWLVKENTW